jgi:hypothetical protein
VTDDNMAKLLHFKKLARLQLGGTAISDVGLRQLTQLKTLTFLTGTDSKMTLEGYRELKKALPMCSVSDDRWAIELLLDR